MAGFVQAIFRHVPWFSFYALLSFTCFTVNLFNMKIEHETRSMVRLQQLKLSHIQNCAEKPTFRKYIANLSGVTPLPISELRARYRSILQNRSPLKYFPRSEYVLRGFCRSVTSFWAVANMGYCLLFIFGRLIQRLVFVELRQSERIMIRDRICRFLFYNILYIFILLNVQTLIGVLLWGTWFSVLCFLHLMTTLVADRFEFFTFSPSTTPRQHGKLIALLTLILLSAIFLCGLAIMIGFYSSGHVVFFMLTKVGLVACISSHLLVQYLIYLYDQHQSEVWLARGQIKYYTNIGFDLATLSIDFAHHLHLLAWSNIFLSVASLVVLMQLRYLFCEFIKRIYRHRNYRRLAALMEQQFPLVEVPEETCAICWVNLTSCRQLPCNHMFHDACLRAWLEQDPSCPTCRRTLSPLISPNNHSHGTGPPTPAGRMARNNAVATRVFHGANRPIMPAGPEPPTRTTHFFHLDGSRYFSWLPSLHVEVSQVSGTRLISGNRDGNQASMALAADQVRAIFPHLPLHVIEEDLRRSGSAEATVDNIVEGRLHYEEEETHHEAQETPHSQSTTSGDVLSSLSSSQLTETEESELPRSSECIGGSRFSKSTHERESILAVRKREMLQQARSKFIHRSSPQSSSTSQDKVTESSDNS